MTTEHFEETLREFIRHEPFIPFAVEFMDGHIIHVPTPRVVFAGGAATFFTPDFDMVEFASEEVRAIRPLVPGPTA